MPKDYGVYKRVEVLEKRLEDLENALFSLIKKVDRKHPKKRGDGPEILGIKT